MVEGLLLNRIDAKPCASPVGGQCHLTAHILPDKAKSAISFFQNTRSRTKIAKNLAILNLMPEPAGVIADQRFRGASGLVFLSHTAINSSNFSITSKICRLPSPMRYKLALIRAFEPPNMGQPLNCRQILSNLPARRIYTSGMANGSAYCGIRR